MVNYTGMARTSGDLDARRKRIMFRAWHRGMKELDILLGTFVDHHIADLNPEDLDALEILMQAEEPELYQWISGKQEAPEIFQSDVLKQILDFHKQGGAVYQSDE